VSLKEIYYAALDLFGSHQVQASMLTICNNVWLVYCILENTVLFVGLRDRQNVNLLDSLIGTTFMLLFKKAIPLQAWTDP
jgi:hypothetical protein